MAEAGVLNTIEDIITCALCRKILVDPKTFSCLHSFCKRCVQNLELFKVGDVDGHKCPLCRRFTPKEGIRVVHLIVQLLDSYHAAKGTQKTPKCTHCPTKDARWHCMECEQQSLCDDCKRDHDRHAKHHVVSLEELKSQHFIIDGPVYCDEHKKYELEVYCTNCKKAMCVMCKVLYHDDHKAQPILDAIKDLLPILDEKKAQLDANIVHNNDEINALKEKKTEEVTEIESEIKKLEERKRATIKDYDIKIETVQDRVTEARQVKRWLETTLSRTKGASLMKELQDGLLGKLDELTSIEIERDSELKYHGSRSWPWSMDTIPKKLKTTITLENTGGNYQYTRFAIMWNSLCVFNHPKSRMLRYQFDGKHLKTTQFPGTILQPRTAIQITKTDGILVSKSGLFLFNENGDIISTISKGDFSDAVYVENKLHVLDQEKGKVMSFKWKRREWAPMSETKLQGFEATYLFDNFATSFLITHDTLILGKIDYIVCYDRSGQKSSKYSSFHNQSCINTCGVDIDNNVLLAYHVKKCLQKMSKNGTVKNVHDMVNYAWYALYQDANTLWVLDDSRQLQCFATK